MLNIRTAFLATTTVLLMLGGATAANAAGATVTSNLNIRAGAGTGFEVIGRLASGARIEIGKCRAGWCELEGRRGYVSQALIRTGNNRPQTQQPDRKPQPQQTQQQQRPHSQQQQQQDPKPQSPNNNQPRR